MPQYSRPRFLANIGLIAVSLLFLPIAHAQKAKPLTWPKSFKPAGEAKIILVQKGDNDRPFVYHTKNFELQSPTALNERNLGLFATTAESVPSVLKRIPLPLLGMPESDRAKVLIYPDEESFVAAGGAQGAAGYYSGRKQAIMLRADTFLNPPPPAGSKLPPKADYNLLVHEFTHLCMHRDLAYLPTWFTEGVAEYIAAMHENKGAYQFSNISSSIRRRIKSGLPNDKEEILLPGIAETMSLTAKDWQERIEQGQIENHYRSYATSLLIVHTLFHGGEKRRTATRQFLEQRQKRPPEADAETTLIPLAERKKLQQRIIDYWRPRGLRLKFTSE
ncbi:hypothetical protein NT6N_08210 [Oceaniferula spumae]|uniref:DUF1570 domain-containing protein n=1 Tax=Oceaniferula spumae TaxID=2979115 RepID=A0AAT9FIA5_9BACT